MTPENSQAEKSSQKFYGLDHLRALAILLVCLSHYSILSPGEPEWLADTVVFCWTGVDLFFVLSGFLIASPLFSQIKQQQKISFKDFFVKRFFRILPAFWATLALYFCIPFFREKPSIAPLWKFLTFTQNLGLDLSNSRAFSHAWSLCVEEHFYLFLPLLLAVFLATKTFNKSYLLLVLLFLFGFATRMFSYHQLYLPLAESERSWVHWYKYVYYPTYNRLDGLLTGVSIAALYVFLPTVWNKVLRLGNLLILLGVGVLTGAYFLCYEQMSFAASVFGFPLVSVGYGLLVLGAISPSCFLYKWNSKITTFVATLSYAVYLTHKGIIHMMREWLADSIPNHNLVMLVCAVACLLGAFILHWAVEKPFMRLRNRFVKPHA